ncbi:MAG TPA: S41 family peptidase [Terriglobales bacterium]|nr:S41 family peptidase [Terriglobales bacterium]
MKTAYLSKRTWALILALALVFSLVGYAEDAAEPATAATGEQRDFAKFKEIFDLYNEYYYLDKAPEDMLLDAIKLLMEEDPALYRELVDALMSSGDKYSHYLDPEEVAALDAEKIYGGIGVTVAIQNAGLAVTELTPGSPAETAGILVGDVIVSIDGHPVKNLTIDTVAEFARGEVGTKVVYNVLRPATGELLSFEMVREELTVVTVTYELKEDYAICRINDFSGLLTFFEFYDFLETINEAGIDNVVFDLRSNPGGDLAVVLDMLNYLIPGEGKPITTVIPRDETKSVTYSTTGRGREMGKMVILVDGHTASAAELFAVVLQEYQLATVIGTATYGKAIGQTYFTLDDGTIAAITTLQATTPTGRKYNELGVAPDVYLVNSETPRVLPACDPLNFENFTLARIGAESAATRALEQRLVLLGFLKEADTLFDEDTAYALSVFQTRAGLAVTGMFDRETLIALTDTVNYLKTITVKNDDQLAAAVAMMEE